MQHRLSGFDEWQELTCFLILHTLLVDRKIHDRKDRWYDVSSIFKTNGKIERVRFRGEKVDEINGVSFVETQTIFVVLETKSISKRDD